MTSKQSMIEQARDKSVELLRRIQTPQGFIASSIDIDNYRRVWSRDGIIAGLAALSTGDVELGETFLATIRTLRDHQDETGRIPSNVSLDGSHVSFGTTVGRIDSSLWYVIACCKYVHDSGDQDFWSEVQSSVHSTIHYLSCLELNGRGLIYVPPGGDWADEYIHSGYVLFDQCLYALALYFFGQVTGDAQISAKYEHLMRLMDVNYFPTDATYDESHVYQLRLYEHMKKDYTGPFPIASFTPFGCFRGYDLFACALIMNLPFPDNIKKGIQQGYQDLQNDRSDDFPIYPAFAPVIDEENSYWQQLKNNHLFRFKNHPHAFHNGGLWPMVHGWFLASKPDLPEDEMAAFAQTLARDDYTFPEYYHGETTEAGGTRNLGFSASGYLLAYDRFTSHNTPFSLCNL